MSETQDQAEQLRSRIKDIHKRQITHKPGPPIIAIASGKGGVGKSNVSVNLAYCLGSKDQKVLLMDADYGLGNTDILLGISTNKSLLDHIDEDMPLDNLSVPITENVSLLPAGSGHYGLANANPYQLEGLFYEMEKLSHTFDYVLVDTGAGIGERVINNLILCDEVIIVTTPDPTSITDSYATIKMVAQRNRLKRFRILVNMANHRKQALLVYNQLRSVAHKYLGINVEFIGWIPFDKNVQISVRQQKSYVNLFPKSDASLSISNIANRLINNVDSQAGRTTTEHTNSFFKNFLTKRKSQYLDFIN